MARRKNPPDIVVAPSSLSQRLRAIRVELYGEHGGPGMARRLNLPARTWYNYETGVSVPAEVLLGVIEQTGVSPAWLLTGEGPKFQREGTLVDLSGLSPVELLRHALQKLERPQSAAKLSHEQREALSDALHADRSRIGDRAWDVADVMAVVEEFLDGKRAKQKTNARAKPKRSGGR